MVNFRLVIFAFALSILSQPCSIPWGADSHQPVPRCLCQQAWRMGAPGWRYRHMRREAGAFLPVFCGSGNISAVGTPPLSQLSTWLKRGGPFFVLHRKEVKERAGLKLLVEWGTEGTSRTGLSPGIRKPVSGVGFGRDLALNTRLFWGSKCQKVQIPKSTHCPKSPSFSFFQMRK